MLSEAQFRAWEGPVECWLMATGAAPPDIDNRPLLRRGFAPVEELAMKVARCPVGVTHLDSTLAADAEPA